MIKFALLLLLVFSGMCLRAQDAPIEELYEEFDSISIARNNAEVNDAYYDRPVDSDAVIRTYALSRDSLISRKAQRQYGWNKIIDSVLRGRAKPAEPKTREVRAKPPRTGFFDFLNSGLVQTVMIAIGVLLLLFIALKFTGAGGLFAFAGKKQRPEEIDEPAEYVPEDAAKRRTLALQQGDYRSAVRFGFILLLADLGDRGLLTPAPDKTNHAYRSELPIAYREGFAKAARFFDYVWYGQAPLTAESYQFIDAHFESVKTPAK